MTTVSLHKPKKFFKKISFHTRWNNPDTAELHAIAKNLISYEADKPESRPHIFMAIQPLPRFVVNLFTAIREP